MPYRNPRGWAPFVPFKPQQGTVIRNPPGSGKGYWVGASSVTVDEGLGRFHMVYRVRRPRGVQPDRGAEIRIAHSHDGITFDDIWSATKDQIDSASLERGALVRRPGVGWSLYVSYVNPSDGRWEIGLVEAKQPDKFDLTTIRPVLTPADIGGEGVKDPFVFSIAGLEHMLVSYASDRSVDSREELHGGQDVFNTGLIQSATGLATSVDGVHWRWEGRLLGPNHGAWDGYCARIGSIWYRRPVWLAMYDGAATVKENYEERCGLAYSFDLRSFQRVTRVAPLFPADQAPGAIRYFDVVASSDATYFYYEMGLPDGSHDLRVYREAAFV